MSTSCRKNGLNLDYKLWDKWAYQTQVCNRYSDCRATKLIKVMKSNKLGIIKQCCYAARSDFGINVTLFSTQYTSQFLRHSVSLITITLFSDESFSTASCSFLWSNQSRRFILSLPKYIRTWTLKRSLGMSIGKQEGNIFMQRSTQILPPRRALRIATSMINWLTKRPSPYAYDIELLSLRPENTLRSTARYESSFDLDRGIYSVFVSVKLRL